MEKQNRTNEIKRLSLKELESLVTDMGLPKFRAKQLYEWIHTHRVASYDDMTNLPKSLRSKLQEEWPLATASIIDKQVSSDGTRKYILEFADGAQVETVGMPTFHNAESQTIKRLSVCFSTQVGCAMACAFCATGKEGFGRNLTCEEMTEQIIAVEKDFGCRVTNVVAMGQGEPFLNYEETLAALGQLNNPESFNIGARHITVSTCGIIRGIRAFSREPEQFTLAISLHSAIQDKRDELMPRVANQPLDQLKRELLKYIDNTNRRVTLEYILIRNLNDGDEDLQALKLFAEGLLCHVNLLPINAIEGSEYQPSQAKTVNRWISELGKAGVEATMRVSRGSDICGACGQLKNSRRASKDPSLVDIAPIA